MKKVIILFVFALLLSCKNNQEVNETVRLEIINKEIISNKSNTNKTDNSIINLITFKLINKSKKRMFFVLDEDNIPSAIPFSEKTINDSSFFGKKGKVLYEIRTNKNVKPSFTLYIADHFSRQNVDCIYDVQKLNEIKKRLKELEIPVINGDYEFSNSIKNNSFILYPKQVKYFKTIISLPKKIDKSNREFSEIKFNYDETYNFNLLYLSDKNVIKKALPSYKIRELQENDIEIFNGKLVSNAIPVKFIN